MISDRTFLAIIPARSGSKPLPRKNVLSLGGKPLINWSIEVGLNSKYIDSVLVGSDGDEILSLAQELGVEVIHRPVELAQDNSNNFDPGKSNIVISNYHDYVVLLQPTSPLSKSLYIDEAIQQVCKHAQQEWH